MFWPSKADILFSFLNHKIKSFFCLNIYGAKCHNINIPAVHCNIILNLHVISCQWKAIKIMFTTVNNKN